MSTMPLKEVDKVEILTGCRKLPNQLVGLTDFRQPRNPRRTRLDRNEGDTGRRQRLVNSFDEFREMLQDILRLLAFG